MIELSHVDVGIGEFQHSKKSKVILMYSLEFFEILKKYLNFKQISRI